MPARDLPDWGAQTAQKIVHEVTDLGELAVRLGSIDSYERWGDVIWMDDFENGLNKWDTFSDGAGASVGLSLSNARNGLLAARLVGGSDGSKQAEIERFLPFLVLGPFGIEYSFAIRQPIDLLRLGVVIYDGVNSTIFNLDWKDGTHELRYTDDTGATVVFANGFHPPNEPTLFHTVKLVLDGEKGEYHRFMLDDKIYSLSGISGQVSADGTRPSLRFVIRLFSRVGNNDVIYVDDVIVTQNENV